MMTPVATQRDPLSLDEQVCFALVVAARKVLAIYRPVLEPMGLTHPQYLVMLALWGRSPLSVKELSAQLALDPGTLSPLLKRLEAAGLVVRSRDEADERLLAVRVTDAGRELRRKALGIPPMIAGQLGMGAAELAELHRFLNGVIVAADAALGPDANVVGSGA